MHRTVIGGIQAMHTVLQPGGNALPRKYFLCDGFNPSDLFIEVADAIANGTEGAVGVVRSNERGTSFFLVCQAGFSPDDVYPTFIKAFQRKLSSTRREVRHHLVGGESSLFVPPDPQRELMETYSDRYRYINS